MFLTHLSFWHDHVLQIRFVVGGRDHRNIKIQGITRVILDALKSLLSFHLDIDVNARLNYDANYLLYVNVIRKAIAKAIYLFIYLSIYLFIFYLTCKYLYNKSQLTSTIKTRLDVCAC